MPGENALAIETFNWKTQIQAGMQGMFVYATRSAKFGDGYEQIAGDGINPETQSWPITMSGLNSEMLPALAFIRQHITKSFIWTPPNGAPGLYRVDPESVRAEPLAHNVTTITATFKQAPAP